MQYIKLNNDSYILHTSKGATQFTRNSFNFHKIQKLVEEGAEEEVIAPLLEAPELPDGIYMLYKDPIVNKLFYKHSIFRNGKLDEYYCWLHKPLEQGQDWDTYEFLGNYSSIQDIKYDWPEYLL